MVKEDGTKTLNIVSIINIFATVILSVVVAAFAFGNDTAKKDAVLHNTANLVSTHLQDTKELAEKDTRRDISIALIIQKLDIVQAEQIGVKTDVSELKKLVTKHMADWDASRSR
ncbi:MAG: hypothetical protein NTX52_05285 [Planctomycetota bacterium]|nr:hypothetical protein [Planctomycetota bacterium]